MLTFDLRSNTKLGDIQLLSQYLLHDLINRNEKISLISFFINSRSQSAVYLIRYKL